MSLITEIVGIGSTPVLSEVVVVVVHIARNGFQEKSDNPVVRVLTLRRTRRGGGGGRPIRFSLNFSKTIFYQHLPFSVVAVGISLTHILTRVW